MREHHRARRDHAEPGDAAEVQAENVPPHPTPRSATALRQRRRHYRHGRSLDADRIAPDSSAATFPVVGISPLEHGRNGAGVWFVRNSKHLGRQTSLTAPIECKELFRPGANRP